MSVVNTSLLINREKMKFILGIFLVDPQVKRSRVPHPLHQNLWNTLPFMSKHSTESDSNITYFVESVILDFVDFVIAGPVQCFPVGVE
jgi:hypothetical protein